MGKAPLARAAWGKASGAAASHDSAAAAAAAVAAAGPKAQAKKRKKKQKTEVGGWSVGDRVTAVYDDGGKHGATITKLQQTGAASGICTVYSVDWDDGDEYCRERTADQILPWSAQPQPPDSEPPQREQAAAATQVEGARAHSFFESNSLGEPAATVPAPVLAPEEHLGPEPVLAQAAPAAAAEVPPPSRFGRVRKQKASYDPQLEGQKPQWASQEYTHRTL